jgi:cytochrome c-type biogenesis protein CcmH/NrfG
MQEEAFAQMRNNQLINSLVIASSVIVLSGAALYTVIEQPDNVPVQTEKTQVSTDKAPSVDMLVIGLEARLAANPEDAKGWILLARSHDHLGNDDKAWQAYARARELGMTDDSLELKLAANLVGRINN